MEAAIRYVEPRDLEAVMLLAPRLLVGVDPSRPADGVRRAIGAWIRESVEAAETDGHAGWVAVLAGNVVGFVSVCEEEHWSGEPDAWVGELMVAEQHEGHGIARSLIAHAEAWATTRGLRHVRLSTGAANHGARAFYERLGYGLNEVTMTRDLPSGLQR